MLSGPLFDHDTGHAQSYNRSRVSTLWHSNDNPVKIGLCNPLSVILYHYHNCRDGNGCSTPFFYLHVVTFDETILYKIRSIYDSLQSIRPNASQCDHAPFFFCFDYTVMVNEQNQ